MNEPGSPPTKDELALPRWVRAFLAARAARISVELVDARYVAEDFNAVVEQLAAVEDAIAKGRELPVLHHSDSPGRRYAAHSPRCSPAANAALAVDDVYALVTQEASRGRGGRTPAEFQVFKMRYAIGCVLAAVRGHSREQEVAAVLAEQQERALEAVTARGSWSDDDPMSQDGLAAFLRFDLSHGGIGGGPAEIERVLNQRLLAELRSTPTLLHDFDPRKFEVLVAEILESFGYGVELTAATRDGGRDLIATRHEPTRMRCLVECKRYAPSNSVGIALVQRLHGVVQGEGATMGILATTSSFTRDAHLFLSSPHVEYRLEGRDLDGIMHWLSSAEVEQRVRRLVGGNFVRTLSGLVIPEHARQGAPTRRPRCPTSQ